MGAMQETGPLQPGSRRIKRQHLVPVPVIVIAVVAAAAGATIATASRAIVALLLRLPLPLFPGHAGGTYYASQLRSSAIGWTVLAPAFIVSASCCWRWLTGPGPSLGGSRRAQTAIVFTLVALVLAGTNLIPRQRTGDEPAYLAVARSLVRDHDIEVPEIGGLLHPSPAALRRGKAISRHAPGMSALLAGPLALFGEAGIRMTTAALGLAFVWILLLILEEHTGEDRALPFVLLVGITFPVVTYSGLLFPDLAAAVAFAILYRSIIQKRGGILPPTLAIAAVVWFNSRYVLPAVFLAGWELVSLPSRRTRRLLIPSALAASLAFMAWCNLRWFGSPSPFAAWHGMPHMTSLSNLIPGTLGVLVDQQYGALVWAPVLLLFPIGLAVLAKRSVKEAVAVIALGGLTVGPGLLIAQWYAGWSPAARFFVPVLGPLMLVAALGLEWALDGRRWSRLTAKIVTGAQLVIGFGAAMIPGKVFGTFETASRNYFLDLVGRAIHVDTTWIVPSIRSSRAAPTLIHATILVGVWLLVSVHALRTRPG